MPREQERHRQFSSLRSHGEWFRYEGELIEFVAAMEHPFSYLLDRPGLWPYADGWGPIGSAPAARPSRSPSANTERGEAKWNLNDQPYCIFPLRPGHSINAEGIEVGPDGLPPVDF